VTEVVKNKAGKFIAGEFQLSDESYRNLIKNGSDMISVLDLQGNYKYVSPTASPILGYEGQFLLNKSAFDFIHPDDKDAVFAYFSQFGKVKKLTIQPFRFKHKNGSWVWLETIVTDLTDEPSINGIVTNSRDITERINAQEQLKMSQEKYKSLFEFSPIPKWIIELETLKFLDVNVTAINHYGFSKEEFLNMTVKDIRPPDELSKFFFAIKDINQS
jgi:PAS domain S-box-containing protein